jgi:hypothetical protein
VSRRNDRQRIGLVRTRLKKLALFEQGQKKPLCSAVPSQNIRGYYYSVTLREAPVKDTSTKSTQFLEVGDLMRRWNVSRQTVERWWRENKNFPPTYRFPGSKIRKFKETDVEQFERASLSQRG